MVNRQPPNRSCGVAKFMTVVLLVASGVFYWAQKSGVFEPAPGDIMAPGVASAAIFGFVGIAAIWAISLEFCL